MAKFKVYKVRTHAPCEVADKYSPTERCGQPTTWRLINRQDTEVVVCYGHLPSPLNREVITVADGP